MSTGTTYERMVHVGGLLRQCRRMNDSAEVFRQAIEAQPQRPEAYAQLALVMGELPDKRDVALALMDRAIGLDPESGEYFARKAYLLAYMRKPLEAVKFADTSLRKQPDGYLALLAKASAYTDLAMPAESERWTRRLLEIYPGDTSALNLLAQSLRNQGRRTESNAIIRSVLSRCPNDTFTLVNAGTDSLKSGQPQLAHALFRKALRLDPHSESARRGLLQAYRERIWLFRVYVTAIDLFPLGGRMEKFAHFVLVWLCAASTGLLLVALLMMRPLSNFFLYLDPHTRKFLTRKERLMALLTGVGTGVVLDLLALDYKDLGLLLIIAAIYLIPYTLSALIPWWLEAREGDNT